MDSFSNDTTLAFVAAIDHFQDCGGICKRGNELELSMILPELDKVHAAPRQNKLRQLFWDWVLLLMIQ